MVIHLAFVSIVENALKTQQRAIQQGRKCETGKQGRFGDDLPRSALSAQQFRAPG
jgi:hypothetical protein